MNTIMSISKNKWIYVLEIRKDNLKYKFAWSETMKYTLAIFLLLISFNTYAELHKWVDADGKVHYSDEPPPDSAKKTETLNIRSSSDEANSPASAPQAMKSIMEQEADLKKRQKEKLEAAQKEEKKQEEAQTKQKNCNRARNDLATLQNTPRLATYDANGNQVIMDDTARQSRIEDAQQSIKDYCN